MLNSLAMNMGHLAVVSDSPLIVSQLLSDCIIVDSLDIELYATIYHFFTTVHLYFTFNSVCDKSGDNICRACVVGSVHEQGLVRMYPSSIVLLHYMD